MGKSQRRGYEWEKEVAELFGGERKRAGPGTDVLARGLTIECKSQQDYSGLKQLVKWLDQAKSYHERWVLAVKLGMRNKKLRLAVLELDELERLTAELEYYRVKEKEAERADREQAGRTERG